MDLYYKTYYKKFSVNDIFAALNQNNITIFWELLTQTSVYGNL